jgi:hypothetical protein
LVAGPTSSHLPWFGRIGRDGRVVSSVVFPFDAKTIPMAGPFFLVVG